MVSHPVNDREQDTVVMDYVESILQYGYLRGVRSHAWAQLSPGDGPPYKMLSCDKLAKAVKYCYEHHKSNPNVAKTIQQGLPDVEVYVPRMPDDVAKYLVVLNNTFHGGSKVGCA